MTLKTHETFTKPGHAQGHKTSLNTVQTMYSLYVQIMLCDQDGIKLEVSRKSRKS